MGFKVQGVGFASLRRTSCPRLLKSLRRLAQEVLKEERVGFASRFMGIEKNFDSPRNKARTIVTQLRTLLVSTREPPSGA